MKLLNTGKNKILEVLKNEIEKGELGTGDVFFDETQTSLTNPVASTKLNVVNTISNNSFTVKIDYELPEITSNNTIFKEYGFYYKDGTLISKSLIPEISKFNKEKIEIVSYIRINQE